MWALMVVFLVVDPHGVVFAAAFIADEKRVRKMHLAFFRAAV